MSPSDCCMLMMASLYEYVGIWSKALSYWIEINTSYEVSDTQAFCMAHLHDQ